MLNSKELLRPFRLEEKRHLRKINGLKFLCQNFGQLCVDCLFVNSPLELNQKILDDRPGRIWRVRSGRRVGSEFGSPQKTLHSISEVMEFIQYHSEKDPTLEFVIHRVTARFFDPVFVGTIALREKNKPSMFMEFQTVNPTDIVNMDRGGKRPRDWETVLSIEFEYYALSSKIKLCRAGADPANIKNEIYSLWQVGRELCNLLERHNYPAESVARFNIYSSGAILLDDLRSASAFR